MLFISKNSQLEFFNETLLSLNIDTPTAAKLGIAQSNYQNDKPSISFQYQNIVGDFVDYTVHRLLAPITNKQGKIAKYLNPSGLTNQYYFNGVNVLRPQLENTIYFTEGQKKAIALCQGGVFAVGNTGLTVISKSIKDNEGKTISHEPKKEYLELIERYDFQNTCLLLDTDFRHHKGKTERYKQFLGAVKTFKSISNSTNKVPYLACLTNLCGVKAVDDIKDYAIKESVLQGLKILKSNKYVHIWRLNDFSHREIEYLVSGKFQLNQYFTTEKYLSKDDTIKTLIHSRILDTKEKFLLIRSATGKGKTQFIIEFIHSLISCNKAFNEKHQKICLVFPTNSLLESLAERIKNGANSFIFNQYTSTEEREYLTLNIQNYDITLTTYVSYDKVAKGFNENDLVFFDEFHYAMSNMIGANFNKAYHNTIAKKILVTATPILEFNYCQNIEVAYISDYVLQSKKQLNTFYCKKNLEKTVSHYVANLSRNKNDLHVLFVNDKELIDNLETSQSDFEVIKLYSSDIIKGGADYQAFLQNGMINRKTNKPLLVLATKFVYEGVSFLNENVTSIAIFKEPSPIDTIQALNRFRKANKKTVFNVFLATKKKEFTLPFNRVFEIANSYASLRNNRFIGSQDVKSAYDNLIISNTFLDYFTEDGAICDFSLAGKYAKTYNILEYLNIEFDVIAPTIYDFSEPDVIAQTEKNKLDYENIALDLLQNDSVKAASLVLSHYDNCAKNAKEFKNYLKAECHAVFDIDTKKDHNLFKYLKAYFSLKFKIESIAPEESFEIKTIWKNKGKRRANSFVNELKIKGVAKLAKLGIDLKQASFKGKQNAIFIDRVFSLVSDNFLSKTYGKKKDVYQDVYVLYIEKYEKDFQKAKIATDLQAVKDVVNALFTIKMIEKSSDIRTYKIE